MKSENFKNKPLVEAIFDFKWKLEERKPGMKIDPQFSILIGSFYDKVKREYPFHEQLPASMILEGFAPHVPHHRFRKGENQWPLIQIGPGIATLNETDQYTWENFQKKIKGLLNALMESYPNAREQLKPKEITLRYIDAIVFNYSAEDIFEFLKSKMKMNFQVYPELFKNGKVGNLPKGLDFTISFPCDSLEGEIILRFVRGKKGEEDALIWETMVHTSLSDSKFDQNKIQKWVRTAHDLTHKWFFKIIAGELQGRFE
jgi:uncharacterized protein (TIGR04255 family)